MHTISYICVRCPIQSFGARLSGARFWCAVIWCAISGLWSTPVHSQLQSTTINFPHSLLGSRPVHGPVHDALQSMVHTAPCSTFHGPFQSIVHFCIWSTPVYDPLLSTACLWSTPANSSFQSMFHSNLRSTPVRQSTPVTFMVGKESSPVHSPVYSSSQSTVITIHIPVHALLLYTFHSQVHSSTQFHP